MSAFFGGLAYFVRWSRGRWRAAVEQVAQHYNIACHTGSLWRKHQTRASGSLSLPERESHGAEMSLVIDSYTRGSGRNSGTYSRIELFTNLPSSMVLKGDNLVRKFLASEDHVIGDTEFDTVIAAQGLEHELRARLTHSARQATLRAVRDYKVELSEGKLSCTKQGLVTNPGKLQAMVEAVVEMGRRLHRPKAQPIAARLAEQVRNDPSAGAREHCLRLLHETFPQAPSTPHAVNHALEDPALEVRLLAISAVTPASLPRLEACIRDKNEEDSLRAAALDRLSEIAPTATTQRLLEELTPDAHRLLLRACLNSAAQTRHCPPSECLTQLLKRSHGATRVALARCLAYPSPEARPTCHALLLTLLGEQEADEVKTAAAQSLSLVGEREAVEALLPLTKGLFVAQTLKQAARGAITAIQSRLVAHADAGQLSVAAAEGGDLSMSEESGALSEVTEEA